MTDGTKSLENAEFLHVLRLIFRLLLDSGVDRNEVKSLATRALDDLARKSARKSPPPSDVGLATASRVLDAWHRRRQYITEKAEPRAIPLLGRAPSVQALVRSENARCNSEEFALRLKALGFLRRFRGDLFKPVMAIAVIAELDPFIRDHIARSSAMLLQTISQNVSTPKRHRKLIERFAEVPDLPAEYAEEFRRFSQEQGSAMLRTLNDWLESRRKRRGSTGGSRTVRAGVHLYAYVDPAHLGRT